MLDPSETTRIDRRCAAVLLKAVNALPRYLEDADPDKAAAIVADLIKHQLSRPIPEPDPAAALAEVIRQVQQEAEAEGEHE